FAEVEYTVAERHLSIERQVVRKAVFPIDAKAEETYIELARFRFVEDTQNWHRGMEAHAAGLVKSRRIRATSPRVTQPSAWSLTSPIACMKAYTVVGPTKRQPSFLSSFEIAIDSADVETGSVAA